MSPSTQQPQTLNEILDIVSNIYATSAQHIKSDLTINGQTINSAVSTYLNNNSLANLKSLNEEAYLYMQNLNDMQSLSINQVALKRAAENLYYPTKTFIHDRQIGTGLGDTDITAALNALSASLASSAENYMQLSSLLPLSDYVSTYTLVGTDSVQVGTLGSFYECNAQGNVTTPAIATGASTVSGRSRNDQICNNWAYSKEFSVAGVSKILGDTSSPHVYVTGSSTGPCYDAVGSLMTRPIVVKSALDLFSESYLQFPVAVPSIRITCSGGDCVTDATIIDQSIYVIFVTYMIPPLDVACVESGCRTDSIDISQYSILHLPALSFSASTFPYTIPGDTVGRVVSHNDGVYATASMIYSGYDASFFDYYNIFYNEQYYVIPSQLVTCTGNLTLTCSVDAINVDNISLRIPSQLVTSCTGVTCGDVAEVTNLTDSAGNIFAIPARAVACENSTCIVESKIIEGEGVIYPFYSPSQTVSCSGSTCSVPAMFLSANQSSFFTSIPSLDVGMLGATAGSLYAVCMYHLDH